MDTAVTVTRSPTPGVDVEVAAEVAAEDVEEEKAHAIQEERD